MEMTNTDSLKEQLMTTDPEFRELAREHGRYEERLSELSALTYPSDEEQLEEITLKKKKLAIKDQMHSIMFNTRRAGAGALKSASSNRTTFCPAHPAAQDETGRAKSSKAPPFLLSG